MIIAGQQTKPVSLQFETWYQLADGNKSCFVTDPVMKQHDDVMPVAFMQLSYHRLLDEGMVFRPTFAGIETIDIPVKYLASF